MKTKKKQSKKEKIILVLSSVVLLLIVLTSAIFIGKGWVQSSEKSLKARAPVFAGAFYPSEKDELARTIDNLLENAEKKELGGKVKALIVPHAGYFYSGQIAATGFKQIESEYETVFLLGPSHRYPLTGISILNVDEYYTPLGSSKLSKKAKEILKEGDAKTIPEAHLQEHSLEVELPFLQRKLKKFEIVPILVGKTNPSELKEMLSKYLGEKDLIVVSVDLSHYHSYEDALALDSYTIEQILELNEEEILNAEIDAPWAVSGVLKLAKEKSWKPRFLAYANSGDITGNLSRVVGYSAIAFVEELSPKDKKFLLELARKSIEKYLKKGEIITFDESKIPENLKVGKGCFVTLTKNQKLRGCIGNILPQEPLYKCVIRNAINAATNDPRFERVEPSELKEIKIEISVLDYPSLLEHKSADEILEKLKPGEHGVILKLGQKQSTYLPSVWEQIPNKKEFLSNLCVKGGMPENCWKDPSTKIYTYTTTSFEEEK